ncbi:MAG: NADH-quinone oxidoreductase subunit C [Clostridiales bacterium]|nr:NADH-quinone oxidoreductase subunit C [Clostridiales bacterium]
MSEKKYLIQNFVPVTASELLGKVQDLKADGYRLGQACCTKLQEGLEIMYSFDKDHELLNLKLTVGEGQELESISNTIWHAFIYENEMHDLFGVKFNNSVLDYGGHFFKVAEPTPWNPNNEERKAEQNG